MPRLYPKFRWNTDPPDDPGSPGEQKAEVGAHDGACGAMNLSLRRGRGTRRRAIAFGLTSATSNGAAESQPVTRSVNRAAAAACRGDGVMTAHVVRAGQECRRGERYGRSQRRRPSAEQTDAQQGRGSPEPPSSITPSPSRWFSWPQWWRLWFRGGDACVSAVRLQPSLMRRAFSRSCWRPS